MKDQPLNPILLKGRKHTTVHLPCFPTQVDLAIYFLCPEINDQSRVCHNKGLITQLHAMLNNVRDLRILLREIIQRIEG